SRQEIADNSALYVGEAASILGKLDALRSQVPGPTSTEQKDRLMATPAKLASTEDVLQIATEAARRYVSAAPARRVTPTDTALSAWSRLHDPFPENPCDPRDVVALLDEIGSPATVVSTGGRYFGFVNGGALPASVGAHCLAGAWDQNANYRVASPIG